MDYELAELLNVGKSQISNYRKGRCNLGTLTLIRCWAIDGESWAIRALVELRKHENNSHAERRDPNRVSSAAYDRRTTPEGYTMTTDDESEWSRRALKQLAKEVDAAFTVGDEEG